MQKLMVLRSSRLRVHNLIRHMMLMQRLLILITMCRKQLAELMLLPLSQVLPMELILW